MTRSQTDAPVPEGYAFDIFVSYSHDDLGKVRPLVLALREAGFRVFDATDDLIWGENISARISLAINESSCAMIFLSDSYTKSDWCEKEISVILRQKAEKLILPITLDDTQIPKALQQFLNIRLADVTQVKLVEKTRAALDAWASSRKELPENLSDEDLAHLIQTDRSHKAFNVLFDRYFPHVVRMATKMHSDRMDAEDVAVATMMRCWEAIGRYDVARGPFRAWLLTIARRTAIDNQRHRLRDTAESAKLLNRADPSGSQGISVIDSRDQILRAMDSLSAEEKHIIDLYIVQGLSGRDVADLLGLPTNVLNAKTHRVLERLRNSIAHSQGERS